MSVPQHLIDQFIEASDAWDKWLSEHPETKFYVRAEALEAWRKMNEGWPFGDPTLANFHEPIEVKHATSEGSRQKDHQPQYPRTDEKRKAPTEAGCSHRAQPGQKAK